MNTLERTHELKTWPEQFRAVLGGAKRHEFRWDDRDFKLGDVLILREWSHESGYSGAELLALVTWLTLCADWGGPLGFVCMSIQVAGSSS